MARRGRKRLQRHREPNGRPQRERETPAKRAAQLPHRRSLGAQAVDHRAVTVLGRLVLRQQISQDQGLAGEVYLRQWRCYVATLGGPAALSNNPNTTMACDGCPAHEFRRFCKCDHVRNIWKETRSSLSNVTRREVDDVVLYDRQPDNLLILRMGLSALAVHFGLTKPKQGLSVINARSEAMRTRPA